MCVVEKMWKKWAALGAAHPRTSFVMLFVFGADVQSGVAGGTF